MAPEDPAFARLLLDSHLRVVGRPLAEPDEPARWLYRDTAWLVLAHRPGPDPRFCYANLAAQHRNRTGRSATGSSAT